VLITAFAIEIAILLYHGLGPREELAQHLQVLYGLQSGNEGWAARLSGSLAWAGQLAILAGALLLMLDRRNKRAAERAKAKEAAAPPPPH
jgi:hypothetical protein